MSAVSKKVTPASSAASTTRRVPSSSTRRPKLLHPSPRTLTWSEPIVRVSISIDANGVRSRGGADDSLTAGRPRAADRVEPGLHVGVEDRREHALLPDVRVDPVAGQGVERNEPIPIEHGAV